MVINDFSIICNSCYNKNPIVEETEKEIIIKCESCGNKENISKEVGLMGEKTIASLQDGLYIKGYVLDTSGFPTNMVFTTSIEDAYPISKDDKIALSKNTFIKFLLVKLVVDDSVIVS